MLVLEWVISCCCCCFFCGFVGYILFSGLTADVVVFTGSPPIKKITFAYKYREGAYKHCGQLFKESTQVGPKLSSICIYYDDPKKVPGPRCRYAVGSILSEGDERVDEELLRRYETNGFNVFSFPEVTHVVNSTFPHRTAFSILLGVRNVYPRLELYIKEKRLCAHPFLEVYRGGLIHFMAPLARQGDFYVPEVRQAGRRLSEDADSDASGAESNSECSSGSSGSSGFLLTDSREVSPAAASSPSLLGCSGSGDDVADWERARRSSKENWFGETDWELTNPQRQAPEHLGQDSLQKSLEVQELWGMVGGEE